MKLKLSIAIVLTVASGAGVWLWFHQRPQPADQPVSKLVKPDIASLPRLVPVDAPKMTRVMARPAKINSRIQSPTASDWSAVQAIINPDALFEDRLTAISSLSGHLPETDWQVLKSFMLKPDDADKVQRGQAVKNQLLDALCSINPAPTGLGDMLIQLYRDHKQDDVIRDYAVQHLTAYYEQMSAQPDDGRTGPAVQKVLWEAVTETSDSIGGTALLALKRLSQEYSGFDQDKIAATALQLAGDDKAGELTHITAFQVCAQLGTVDALPLALQAAQNGETIAVRMSATAALGALGGPEQIPFLNSLLQGDEDRLKPAAQNALAQITIRQAQMASRK